MSEQQQSVTSLSVENECLIETKWCTLFVKFYTYEFVVVNSILAA